MTGRMESGENLRGQRRVAHRNERFCTRPTVPVEINGLITTFAQRRPRRFSLTNQPPKKHCCLATERDIFCCVLTASR